MSEAIVAAAPHILQHLTETLAAAITQPAVLEAALTPAITALDALSGAILLLDQERQRLTVQAADGLTPQTLWQDGPLTSQTPAGDAILHRQARYYEHAGSLKAAYPDLEERTGGVAAVATAVLPLLLADQALGVLILDFKEPHEFDRAEQQFLITLAAQTAIGLDRAALIERLDSVGARRQLHDRTAELSAEREALRTEQVVSEAFVMFTEAAGRMQTVQELGDLAMTTLHVMLPGVTALFYEPGGDAWYPLAWTPDITPELLAVLQAGLPQDTPILAQMMATRQPIFLNGWTKAEQGVGHTESYNAVAAYPVMQEGTVTALLSLGLQTSAPWTDAQCRLISAIGRSFTLLYDRISFSRQLQEQRDEAEKRSQALEAFAEMSRDLAEETNRYTLVRRAQEIMLSLLTPGYALYWEQAPDHWELKSQVGDIGNPDLQRLVDDHGLPLDTPALHSTWLTGVPNYQDNYAQGADTPAEMIRHVNAATAFRVMVRGQPLGMLAIGLFDQRKWTPMDKAVLETAIYSLGLVLERAQGFAALEKLNSELRIANEELQAFAYSVSHDLRTPVRHVKGFAELAVRAFNQRQSEKTLSHMGTVVSAADRMTRMIDAMLSLSRAGRTELVFKPVHLKNLVQQAQGDVTLEFPEQAVIWEIEPLPVVQADAASLQQVFTNLLSNAVKFAVPGQPLRVRAWAEERPHEWAVFVQDTGIGFDQQYAGKLFGVFQRLHTQDQFEGTGVGLATIKRIVTRHGGQVWAEGQPGVGATFGFTLPKEPFSASVWAV